LLSASERLRLKLDVVAPRPADGQPFWLLDHPHARELYPRYLAASYHIGGTLVPLMEAALRRARELGPDDAVAAGLAAYLERHIPEELHGDEPGGGMLDDLAALGVDVATLRAELPSPKIAALVGAQYYWILHQHPVAVFGFLELEAYHLDVPTVEALIEKTGLPREGFGQLLLHAELDAGHARDMHRVLDSLPLEPYHEQLIAVSALQTVALVSEAVTEAVEGEALELPALP